MRDQATSRHPVTVRVPAGEESLALHTWDDGRPGLADLFYVHGLQSHAGWLFETGPALLERGVRLTVLDRRGSGASSGSRGHVPDARTVLDDYGSALGRVAAAAPGPVTLLGQSFGGSLVAALVASGQVPDGTRLVLCAPALGQQRARLDQAARDRVRRARGTSLSVVRLEDEQYTEHPGYLRLMANDGLMVRSVTDSFRAAMVETEDLYVEAGPAPGAGVPCGRPTRSRTRSSTARPAPRCSPPSPRTPRRAASPSPPTTWSSRTFGSSTGTGWPRQPGKGPPGEHPPRQESREPPMLTLTLYEARIAMERPFRHARKVRAETASVLVAAGYRGETGWGRRHPAST
ncbi:alpha/beta fold hydrolase [Streptomyces albus]|nr:alpha/beta fold hydrolase [Streptomyces albus]